MAMTNFDKNILSRPQLRIHRCKTALDKLPTNARSDYSIYSTSLRKLRRF